MEIASPSLSRQIHYSIDLASDWQHEDPRQSSISGNTQLALNDEAIPVYFGYFVELDVTGAQGFLLSAFIAVAKDLKNRGLTLKSHQWIRGRESGWRDTLF